MGWTERTAFGKYSVLARLGRGGMGNAYLAVNMGPAGVSKLIVVKELREELASVPQARSMFLDEARIATRLAHPNVVQAFEVVEADGSLYLTMEYVEGQPLQHLIRGAKRARIPLVALIQILADTLAALHYAHELTDYDGTPLGIVHRDVSPHNILVTYEGATKLLDFGIAKAADAKTVTESGAFKGKVRFSAPEQVVGEGSDRRSDVFAAGAVFWEMLTGEQMWNGMPDTKVLVEVACGRIPTARSIKPDVPEKLDAICAKALAFSPDDRYATADDFRSALLEYLREIDAAEVEIAPLMASAFASERREIRAVIDTEVRALREASSDAIRLREVPVINVPPPSAERSATTALARTNSSKPAPNGKVVVPVALLVCGALAIAIYASFPKPPRSEPSVLASVAAPAPSASSSARSRIHVRLSARPSSARLTIDGATMASNPYDSDAPADGALHHVGAQADGFEPREIEARFDREVILDVGLAPVPAAPVSAAAARPHAGHALIPPAAPSSARTHGAIEEEDPYKK